MVVCLGETVSNRKIYKKTTSFVLTDEKKETRRNEGRLKICLLDPHVRTICDNRSIGKKEEERRKAFVSILIALTRPLFLSLSRAYVSFASTITTLTKMFSSPSINTFLTLVLNAITHHSFVHTHIH